MEESACYKLGGLRPSVGDHIVDRSDGWCRTSLADHDHCETSVAGLDSTPT